MVGLPARGKSYLSAKAVSFLKWQGLTAEVFNVGRYRREQTSVEQSGRADFFASRENGEGTN